jgi:hypothetical protein
LHPPKQSANSARNETSFLPSAAICLSVILDDPPCGFKYQQQQRGIVFHLARGNNGNSPLARKLHSELNLHVIQHRKLALSN